MVAAVSWLDPVVELTDDESVIGGPCKALCSAETGQDSGVV